MVRSCYGRDRADWFQGTVAKAQQARAAQPGTSLRRFRRRTGGAGVPFAGGRHGPFSAPSIRVTRSLTVCTSRRNSPTSARKASISRCREAPCASMALRNASPC